MENDEKSLPQKENVQPCFHETKYLQRRTESDNLKIKTSSGELYLIGKSSSLRTVPKICTAKSSEYRNIKAKETNGSDDNQRSNVNGRRKFECSKNASKISQNSLTKFTRKKHEIKHKTQISRLKKKSNNHDSTAARSNIDPAEEIDFPSRDTEGSRPIKCQFHTKDSFKLKARNKSLSSCEAESKITKRRGNEPRNCRFRRLQDSSNEFSKLNCKGSKIDNYFLEKLKCQCPSDVMYTLLKVQTSFTQLLETDLEDKTVTLILEVLGKVCEGASQSKKTSVVALACQPKFLGILKHCIYKLPINYVGEELVTKTFLSNIFKFSNSVIQVLPQIASEKLKDVLISITLTLHGLETYQNMKMELEKEQLSTLQKELSDLIEIQLSKGIKLNSNQDLQSHTFPPDNFREKSIYPSNKDLVESSFLRPNIIDGAYRDVDHYLDVQFRLMREDFLIPLREVVSHSQQTSFSSKKTVNASNVKIYHNVKFGNQKIINDKIGHIVHFNGKRKPNVKWESSKRLLFGSLLVFTNNNFKDILFATVLEREVKYLKKGTFAVYLYDNNNNIPLTGEFLMLESEVFFDPYYHIMDALKNFNSSNFPLVDYIVFVEKKCSPPKYILHNPYYAFGNGTRVLNILKQSDWPNLRNLDQAQMNAFKGALTEELVIIQGPPGTGKTFIGLEITNVLLQNAAIWNYNHAPILVVCYTNHALDQFLEGILKLTNEIVRIGGQSKSQVLNDFNIKQLRKSYKFRNSTSESRRDIYKLMVGKMKSLEGHLANLRELEKQNGIVSAKTFMDYGVITSQHCNAFNPYVDYFMWQWLLEGVEGINENATAEENNDSGNEDIEEEEEESPQDNVNEIRQRVDIDDEFLDLNVLNIEHSLQYCVNFKEVEYNINSYKKLRNEIINCESENYLLAHEIEHVVDLLEHELRYFKAYVRWKQSTEYLFINGAKLSYYDVWSLPVESRWILYQYWVESLKQRIKEKVVKEKGCYQYLANVHEQLRHEYDLQIMQKSLVVGMTTTGAARLHTLLQHLKPKIVIVEEAAEVFETHVVVSLTKECEHLILIGDHQQLRPSPATYRLACDFNFDVSLFERMVKNGMKCYCLEKQHRMRPEISKLISPSIYPKLKDDESVFEYPPIKGVTKSLFFIAHNIKEDQVDDTTCHMNTHEADFLIELSQYLICQGYEPTDITILSGYSGQMKYLTNQQKKFPAIKNVLITVIDNYQGEENKIILLSLVRSNPSARIGFLKTVNRVCVALSRAREGLYIIGNMDNLVKSSDIWPQIKKTLVEQESYGAHLTLQCQNHRDQKTEVSSKDDFRKVPSTGGCNLDCLTLLNCGHICGEKCHIKDRNHEKYRCRQKCERFPEKCELKHQCTKLCYEECGDCMIMIDRILSCGHQIKLPCYFNYKEFQCKQLIGTILPVCGHKVKKLCWKDVMSYKCTNVCGSLLMCGHSCTSLCHPADDPNHIEYQCLEKCTKTNTSCPFNHLCEKLCFQDCGKCYFVIDRKLPNCNHTMPLLCSQDLALVECKKTCDRMMECGHTCPKLCSEPCGNCQFKVTKSNSTCGHRVKIECSRTPDSVMCKEKCEKLLSCGHRCKNLCGQPCSVECKRMINSPIIPACGHDIKVQCYLQKDLEPSSIRLLQLCRAPCDKILSCGHRCKGTCGKCLQGRLHQECKEKCERHLICGHKCADVCSSPCFPCSKPCLYQCKHRKCEKECGTQCIPCKKPCNWKCQHLKCSKLCYEVCDRKPCYEPCTKKLKCGHKCIGFCGDACPPLCRICNSEELETVMFGDEEKKDPRFVYLVDCGDTVESNYLEKCMLQGGNEVSFKKCPLCAASILNTQRFVNYFKESVKDIVFVNKIILHKRITMKNNFSQPLKSIEKWQLWKRRTMEGRKNNVVDEMFQLCSNMLKVQRRNKFDYMSFNAAQKINISRHFCNIILNHVFHYLIVPQTKLCDKVEKRIFSHFIFILNAIKEKQNFDAQGICDLKRECERLLMLIELGAIESSPKFKILSEEIKINFYEKALSALVSIDAFINEKELKEIIEYLEKNLTIKKDFTPDNKSKNSALIETPYLNKSVWFKCVKQHIYYKKEENEVCEKCSVKNKIF